MAQKKPAKKKPAAKGGKKGAATAAVAAPPPRRDGRPRLSEHPRARRQIREAKAWGGLVGFVLVALLSVQGGTPLFESGLRALIAGAACYVIAWALALALWRHLARVEVKLFEQSLLDETPQP